MNSRRILPRVTLCAACVTILIGPGCSDGNSPKPAATTESPTIDPLKPQVLWGEMKPVVSVKELMKYTIDPVADNIFNAVGSELTVNGMVDREPKTDEDWEKIQSGAVSLAEAIYLLKVPREFTPPGDLNNSTGPDAVELSPEAIRAKVERDPVEWNARIEALRNASLSVMEIVKKRDVKAMWDAGEFVDQACEACHRSYWYPGENAEFYRRLRDRLDTFTQQPPPGSAATPKGK